MNLILQTKPKMSITRKIIYIVLVSLCVIAIAIGVYMQFFTEAKLDVILGINKFYGKSDEEYENLKADFDNIFTNTLNNIVNEKYNIQKIDENVDLIFTEYENTKNIDGKYNLNVNIPCINIKNDTTISYNKQIKEIFEEKAKSIIASEDSKNIIYTVEYVAYINDNILSLVIKSELKEGASAQRVIVQTYNYDIQNNKEVTIEDVIKYKGIEQAYASNKIKNEIKKVQEQAEELKKLGYSIFTRDYTDEIYKIENVAEFFLGNDGYLYIIYPYGNDHITSEMDLVVF